VFLQHVQGNDLQGTLVGRCEHNECGHPVIVRAEPVRRSHAPPVTRHQAWEPIMRHWCREIITDAALVIQEFCGHERTDRVAALIFGPGRAAAVAIEASDWIRSTRFEFAAENVLLHLKSMSGGLPRSCLISELAPFAVLPHFAQLELLDLAGAGEGELLDSKPLLRGLVRSQVLP
jgi:hypothetical protein